MKRTGDWYPSGFAARLELAKTWQAALASRGQGWGIPGPSVQELDAQILACEGADALVTGDNTQVNRAVRRRAYDSLEAFSRNFKGAYLREPPRLEGDLIAMGLRPKDRARTPTPAPAGFAETDIVFLGPHTVTAGARLSAGSPPDTEGANYGVRLYWGVMPHGGAGMEAATGPRRELARAPQNGDELPHSVFFRGKKRTLEFLQEDSGKTLYLCARYENAKGEAGPWGVISSVFIP